MGLMLGLKMLVDNNEFMKKLTNRKMLTVKAEEGFSKTGFSCCKTP